MQIALRQEQPSASAAFDDSAVTLGAVVGGFSGVVIGVGVSLSIGLFYSGSIILIAGVIIVSMLLGALFGHILANLLADDILLKAPAEDEAASKPIPKEQVIDLTVYRDLKAEREKIARMNEFIDDRYSQAASMSMSLPGGLVGMADMKLFERIVERAHER